MEFEKLIPIIFKYNLLQNSEVSDMKDSPDYKVEQLMKVVLLLETTNECEAFFDDLCTLNELKAFSQRLDVARMLLDGHTYEHIEAFTGATYNTISRVNKTLSKENSLKIILNRIENKL